MRAHKILLIVSIGWVLSNAHRLFHNVRMDINPFLNDVTLDIQWYLKDIGELLFYILLSYILFKISPKPTKIVTGGILIVVLLDLLNYFLWFKRNELVLLIQGIVMMASALKLFLRYNRKK